MVVARGAVLAVLILASAMVLSGCGYNLLVQGEPAFNTGILLPKTNSGAAAVCTSAGYSSDTAPPARDPCKLGLTPLSPPSDCPDNADDTHLDACVYAIKAIIDDYYREYRITLHHFADDGNAAADIASLAFSGASAASPQGVAKTVLAALSAFTTSAKSVVNEDVLYKQSIEIVLNQMDSDRVGQYNTMLKEMAGSKAKGGNNYSLAMARDDLLEYFRDGTFDHAITSLMTTTSANKANCSQNLTATKIQVANGLNPSPPAATKLVAPAAGAAKAQRAPAPAAPAPVASAPATPAVGTPNGCANTTSPAAPTSDQGAT